MAPKNAAVNSTIVMVATENPRSRNSFRSISGCGVRVACRTNAITRSAPAPAGR